MFLSKIDPQTPLTRVTEQTTKKKVVDLSIRISDRHILFERKAQQTNDNLNLSYKNVEDIYIIDWNLTYQYHRGHP